MTFIKGAAVLPMFLPTITYGFAIIYSFGKQPVTWKFVAALRVGGYMTEPLKYLIQLYQTAAERVQGKYNEDVYTI